MLNDVRSDWRLLTTEAMETRSIDTGSVKASAVATNPSI